jgi:small-conductance mechanosensitive channel
MGTSFMGYVWRLWGSPLPMQLMRAILVAALFEALLYLVQVRLRRLLAPVMGRDAEADAVLRLERWRVVVGVPMLLTRVLFYTVALAIVLRIFRFRPDQDLYPLLLGGLALALVAGRDTLRDMVAGYFIRYDHLFGVGDEIAVGEHSGMVSEVSLRATRLRTRDGQEIIIRNGLVRTLVHRTGPGRRANAAPPSPGA